MSYDEIKENVTRIFRDVLDNDAIVLNDATTAEDIEEWDSLAHINIIVAIENEFKFKFELVDIKPLQNVGELLNIIQRKASQSVC